MFKDFIDARTVALDWWNITLVYYCIVSSTFSHHNHLRDLLFYRAAEQEVLQAKLCNIDSATKEVLENMANSTSLQNR